MADHKRAVILLSGGLDSATLVAMVRAQGFSCYTLSFDYGQRHRAELNAAARVARDMGVVEHKVIGLNLNGIGGSALTDSSIDVPEAPSEGIPLTYVPGDVGIVPRNMGHFVENIGDEPIEMLEIFRADEFRDFSLFQWLGETPKKLVMDHLFANDKEAGEKFWSQVKDAKKDPITKFRETEGGPGEGVDDL